MAHTPIKSQLSLSRNYGGYEYANYINSLGADNSSRRRLMLEALHTAVETVLTHRQRTYVTMYYFQGMSMPEIAQLHGRNVSSISRCLKRSRQRLTDYFSAAD